MSGHEYNEYKKASSSPNTHKIPCPTNCRFEVEKGFNPGNTGKQPKRLCISTPQILSRSIK